MADRAVSIKRFVEITGRDDGVAIFYLRCSNWILDDALSNYFANQGDDEVTEPVCHTIKQPPSIGGQEQTAIIPIDCFDKGSSIQINSKINIPQDGTAANNNDDDDQIEVQTSVVKDAGPLSNQAQVLDSLNSVNVMKQIDQIFRAVQHGSIESEIFSDRKWGQDMYLGITGHNHTVIPSDKTEENDVQNPLVVLKLWQTGFTVDNGELRPYNDPNNTAFLETVMRGEVPEELLAVGWEINMDVEDHRHENYKKQKKSTSKTARSAEQASGASPSNSTNPIVNGTAQKTNEMTANNAEIAKDEFSLDVSQPCTTIQIRLADGSCLTTQFNLSHTVADIQHFICTVRPQYADTAFILISTFPTRELTDETLTIEATGLKNAALMQRFK